MTTRNEPDGDHWQLCPECECGVTEVDIEEVGACTNCGFEFDDKGD